MRLAEDWSPAGTSVVFMVNQGIWQVNDDGTDLHEVFHAPRGTGIGDGPTFTPDGQHIIFSRCCTGHYQALWMIDVEGAGLAQVTNETRGWYESVPQVSPDGQRVAFNRCGDRCDVATASIKTGKIRVLTDSRKSASEHPGWSPTSNKIVFHIHYSSGSGDIAIMNANGSHLHRLTFNGPRGKTGSFDPCSRLTGRRSCSIDTRSPRAPSYSM